MLTPAQDRATLESAPSRAGGDEAADSLNPSLFCAALRNQAINSGDPEVAPPPYNTIFP